MASALVMAAIAAVSAVGYLSGGAESGLLPIFAIAVVVATIAICAVVTVPTTVTPIVALASAIGFGGAIVAMLGRLIGPDEH